MEKLELQPLRDAFTSLTETLVELEDIAWFNQQKPVIQDTLIAGAIQKFEFVYELSLKMMTRQLKLMAISDENAELNDFRDVLREAVKKGLIEDIDDWIGYRKMRNITSHTYDYEKAMAVYNQISAFMQRSGFLLQQLEKYNATITD
ncbi:hypothetical protein F542_13470 [Bibersteinia trehalosi USDA-ARS-USMARC-188]|uniref:Nucleotidyltransferase substrate binding protein n=4 Tax=Bibersteinia trehalosi TaxID=47735 RepID=A0A4V7IAK3_BIBTR|nr:nucleotidyltransferase substrate binding protein [Bibersteinia trehalosi]AGH38133.1 hypothetical protein WQG_8560 [Bibersteinia trehalosi USDA-ARS-USMARC-192]AHG82065.1 hypothetical protein F542_13470 [Bibersteinia trehalosi USDA-ARS-USMARC-188]AHG84374.1 hypothetical protein F543_15100 [Bibersteinia trehalosi USDA-ARS-USMARC-189]RRN00993.1 hypothetical protein EIM44_10065 [Bibersteinia trehalosi]